MAWQGPWWQQVIEGLLGLGSGPGNGPNPLVSLLAGTSLTVIGGEIWGARPSGGDDTTALQNNINDCPAGYQINFWPGVYHFTHLTVTKPIALNFGPFTWKRDALGLYGTAGYAVDSNFGGTILRCTATAGTALSITSTETNLAHVRALIVGPGSGTLTGFVYGGANTIISADCDVTIMNCATAMSLQNIQDADLRLRVLGCTSPGGFSNNCNNNRVRLDVQNSAGPFADDSTCIANHFPAAIFQNNTGLSLQAKGRYNEYTTPWFESPGGTGAISSVGGVGNVFTTPTLSSAADTVVLDASTFWTVFVNPRAPVAVAFTDNGAGNIVIGNTSNITFAGTTTTIRVSTDTVLGTATAKTGFFGATPVVKPTVTGSKGANAALTSLLTALANLGILTDSST